jgi:hypothetical protein
MLLMRFYTNIPDGPGGDAEPNPEAEKPAEEETKRI